MISDMISDMISWTSTMDSYMDSSSIDRFLLAGDDDGNREEDDHYVYNEHFGELAPRITGSISVISSALIIYVILRSPNGLSTIYHRIMFGMSFADILGSAAIAFTHLAMPRPGISEIIDNYGFEGTRLGNTDTCTAQAFFFVFGSTATYGYNNSLCVYYACIIAFSMHEARVTRKVEPFLHLLFYQLVQVLVWHLSHCSTKCITPRQGVHGALFVSTSV